MNAATKELVMRVTREANAFAARHRLRAIGYRHAGSRKGPVIQAGRVQGLHGNSAWNVSEAATLYTPRIMGR